MLTRRFLRHLKAFYDVHRYRMAPETYELIEAAEARGQVKILTAHVTGVERTAKGFTVAFRRRGAATDETVQVVGIVNCTGPKQKLSADPTNFLGALIVAGLAKADPLGLGLAVDGDFRVIGNATNFYALGPLTRERFGDTYGAPEIEVQAERLAGSSRPCSPKKTPRFRQFIAPAPPARPSHCGLRSADLQMN